MFSVPVKKDSDSDKERNTTNDEASKGSFIEKFIYIENWRNKRFVIWALATPCALFGYFVPFVHLVNLK